MLLYVGTLMGITNGIATIPGFVSPSVVGALTDGNVSNHLSPTKEEINAFARVLHVCLSVCLSVSKITQKRVHVFG